MLRQHRHVCAFFNSANDEYGTLLPFICEGISCGHRAFHVLPSKHRREHLDRLTAAGVDVAATQNSGQLEVAASEDTYTRGGRFNKEAMLALIQEVLTNLARFSVDAPGRARGNHLRGLGRRQRIHGI
jgi:hypothetical protein